VSLQRPKNFIPAVGLLAFCSALLRKSKTRRWSELRNSYQLFKQNADRQSRPSFLRSCADWGCSSWWEWNDCRRARCQCERRRSDPTRGTLNTSEHRAAAGRCLSTETSDSTATSHEQITALNSHSVKNYRFYYNILLTFHCRRISISGVCYLMIDDHWWWRW